MHYLHEILATKSGISTIKHNQKVNGSYKKMHEEREINIHVNSSGSSGKEISA